MPNRPLFDDRTKLLWRIGFVSPIDFAFVGVELGHAVVMLFWWIFGHPTPINFLMVLAFMAFLLGVWAIVLVYRCCWFVIVLMGEVKELPASSARMVMAFTRGGSAPAPAE